MVPKDFAFARSVDAWMNEAVRVRSLAIDAVRDVTPIPLFDRIEARLEAASITPAIVTLASARYHGELDGFAEGCAGAVQQIFVGLEITRELIEESPWVRPVDRSTDPDLEIIAADVLLARGMSRLAGTDAARAAVQVVREFGQHQAGQLANGEYPARTLESSILDLAVSAGASAVGSPVDPAARATVADVEYLDPFASIFDGTVLEPHVGIPPQVTPASDRVRSGATDTD